MTDISPTRSVVLELTDDRRAMHEGYVFLDEKCLLLAGEMLRELARYERLAAAFARCHDAAMAALQAAVARHGLEGLQLYPATMATDTRVRRTGSALMGVRLQEAAIDVFASTPAGSAEQSPEAETCRRLFAELIEAAAPLAACAGNLERLRREYRRSVRRARALQDVLLPEADRTLSELETRLEELEQEDAIWMRQRASG